MSDFGESKRVVGIKKHRCEYCYGPIPKGESHLNYRGMYAGEWQNWRMHDECYEDFHVNGDDEFMPGEAPMPDRIMVLMGLSA